MRSQQRILYYVRWAPHGLLHTLVLGCMQMLEWIPGFLFLGSCHFLSAMDRRDPIFRSILDLLLHALITMMG